LLGSREFVEQARHNRKRYGGAMRQAGIIAAGALYALEHNLDRLQDDHANAALLGGLMSEVPGLRLTHPVQTNIVIVAVGGLGLRAEQVVAALKDRGVLCGIAAPDRVRFVTHLDVSAAEVRRAGEIAAATLSKMAESTPAGGVEGDGA
jgi:threonine aldolase